MFNKIVDVLALVVVIVFLLPTLLWLLAINRFIDDFDLYSEA